MIASLAKCQPLAFAILLVAAMSSGCSQQGDTKEQHLSKANDYVASEQYAKAEKEYRDVLRLAPEDVAALGRLGIIYFNQGQFLQATQLLNKAVELKSDDIEVQLKRGLLFVAQRELVKAREIALRILEKQPGQQQALMLLADAAVDPEDIKDTRTQIEGLRAKDRDRSGYHLALGMLDLRQKDEAQAETEFKAALGLDPKSSEAYMFLGSLSWTHNDLKAAEKAFKSAADVSPLRSPARLRYAEFKLRTGDTASAKAIYQDINTKAPDFLPPRVALMKIACGERQADDCAVRVKDVLEQDPNNADALFLDGALSMSKGDSAKAIRIYTYLLFSNSAGVANSREAITNAESNLDLAIKLDPHFEPAILRLAELKIRKGVPAAAVDLLVPLTKEKPQLAPAQYLLASAYIAQRQLAPALAVYRQMSELFPKDPQPPFLIGTIQLAEGQVPEARKELEKSFEISSDYLPAVEKLVDLDLADKQYASAIDRTQKIIDKNPKLAQAWALRGKIYVAQRDFKNAEPDLLKAIELEPKLEPAYRLLAQLYVAENKQDQAIAKLNAFVEINKNDSNRTLPALLQLATLQQNLKHFEAARDAYEKLLAIAPNSAIVLNNLAILYDQQFNQLDKAYDLAKKAREAAPNEAHIADTLGWVMFKKSDYRDALPLLQYSAEKLPTLPEVQFHLGMAYYMLGEEAPSIAALQKASESNEDFPGKGEVRQRLAVLRIDPATATGEALKTLEDYIREKPKDPVALLRMAQLQEKAATPDQVIQAYEKIVETDPLFGPALLRLAELYSDRPSDVSKAYELATKARQALPDDPRTIDALGWASFKKGDYEGALKLLKEAAAKLPDHPDVQFHLGLAYYMVGDEASARQELQKAAGAGKDFPGREEARKRLAVLAIDVGTLKDATRTELEKYLHEQPNDPAALVRLAKIQEQDGKIDQAIDNYEKLINQYPLFSPAIRQLAILLSERSSDLSKTYELAEKARSAYPDDAEIDKALGILNFRRGYYPQSVEQLKSASGKRTNDPQLLYYLGAAYHQLKQEGECQKELRHVLELSPPPEIAARAKNTLTACSESAR
jgi:tetratricopeptide (TPR) repeat protein